MLHFVLGLILLPCIRAAANGGLCNKHQPSSPNSGVTLVQTRGSISQTSFPTGSSQSALLDEIHNVTLKQQLAELISSLEVKAETCCNRPCTTSTTTFAPMLCAAFGDPHFITFDGAQTTFVGDSILWLVRSDRIWIQALSIGSEGKLLGLAVGGPFMRGHKLIVYGTSDSAELQVFFDGQRILQQEKSDYQNSELLEAYRRKDWDGTIFNDNILTLRTNMKFEIGSFPDRFQSLPHDGVYMFKFPDSVSVTITGVDFMSAVISMPAQAGGQGGYCGNFNGNADDDAEPVVPSWDRPVGEDLDRVVEGKVLFPKNVTAFLLGASAEAAQRSQAALLQAQKNRVNACPEGLLRQAEAACENLSFAFRKFCMYDVCLTGDTSSAGDVRAAEVMEERTNARGIPIFLGHGQCADSQGRLFRSLQTKLRSDTACQSLLRALALTRGVVGAQRRHGGNCEVLITTGIDPKGIVIPGGWDEVPNPHQQNIDAFDSILPSSPPSPPAVVLAPSDEGMIDHISSDAAWNCWMLD